MRIWWLFLIPAALAAQEPEVEIEPVKTSITVRADVDAPSSNFVTAFDEQQVISRPGVNLDDRLRDIPGFTLFRRSSSLVAHPTTQGVALRGIGSSAASRTLVLYDGLPANDPFGGWVYWARFNPDAIDTVEVSRGASTSAFGDRAMGGSVSLMSERPLARRFSGYAEGGDAGIADARGGYSGLWGDWGASTSVRAFRSEGYFVIPEPHRGPVDRKADVDFVVGDLRLDYLGGKSQLSLRGNVLAEQRGNGTAIRENSSSLGTAGVNYRKGNWAFTGYHSRGTLRSVFSAVSDARDEEQAVLFQRVTSEDSGGSVLWNKFAGAWNLMAGTDAHRASGVSRDRVVFTGQVRRPGGKLWQQGTFVQGDFSVGSRTRVYLGLRHDFADRGNDFWSPRAGVAFAEGPRRWRASFYRGFRSPTLNEFFRQFRVGDITTLQNPNLRPETLTGFDAGVDWRVSKLLVRTTLFWQEIDDLIGNATIDPGPPPLRQRQNFQDARGRGLEVEIQKSFSKFRLETAYLYVDSQLGEDRFMPQVPRHQGSAQLLYATSDTLLSVGVRSYGAQFEDDLNQFLLPGFASVQFMAKRRLGGGVSAVLAIENAFDRRFLTGFTPEPTAGNPRLVRVGLRWESGG